MDLLGWRLVSVPWVRPDTHSGMDLGAVNKHSDHLRSTKQRVCRGRPRNSVHACASAHFNWPDASSVESVHIGNVWHSTVYSAPAVCDRSPWIAAPGYMEHWPRSERTFAPFHRRMETSVCRQKVTPISASFSGEQKDATFSAAYRWNHVLCLLV